MRRARRVPGTKYDPDVVYADHSDESDAFDDDAGRLTPRLGFRRLFARRRRVATMATKGARGARETRSTQPGRRSGIGRRSVGDIRRRGHRPRGGSESEREDEDDACDEVDGDARRVEENPVDALVGSSSRGVGERSACTRDAPADAAGEPTATGDAARGDGTSSGCSHPGAGARFPRRQEVRRAQARSLLPGSGTPRAHRARPRGFREGRRTHRRGKTRMDRERASSGGDAFSQRRRGRTHSNGRLGASKTRRYVRTAPQGRRRRRRTRAGDRGGS